MDRTEVQDLIEMRRGFKRVAEHLIKEKMWPVCVLAIDNTQADEPRFEVVATGPFAPDELALLVGKAAVMLSAGGQAGRGATRPAA